MLVMRVCRRGVISAVADLAAVKRELGEARNQA
jgi:hypothetical protein